MIFYCKNSWINCELEAKCDYEFIISYQDRIEKLLNFFEQQDIQVEDKEFDKKHLIQRGNTN